jgi:hypothetical protein
MANEDAGWAWAQIQAEQQSLTGGLESLVPALKVHWKQRTSDGDESGIGATG